MDTRKRLENYFRAAFPCVALQTSEEKRAMQDVLTAAKTLKKSVVTWSATEGCKMVLDAGSVVPNPRAVDDTNDLLPAMRIEIKKTVFVLRDAGSFPFDRDPILSRAFFDLITKAPEIGNIVVLLGPSFKLWPSVEKLVTIIEYELPSKSDLSKVVDGINQSLDLPPAEPDSEVLKALSGLSITEAENALTLSWFEEQTFSPRVIYREKVGAVRRSGLLDLIDTEKMSLDSIGGLDELKSWILKRKDAFTERAVQFKLPSPKGILLVGVPGSGKSLSAKAIGSALGVPTLRLDIGSLFNSLVGESEARTRSALALAEALSPCVLWVDEIEKGLSGSSGANGDSGTTKRVFGTILSWLQDRKQSVFLVATANDITSLPPEFSRKGRFDEIFALDLPSSNDRMAILKIVIQKYERKVQSFDVVSISERMDGFTGSEIEAAFVEALYAAFDEKKEVTTQHIIDAAKRIIPLSVMAKEKIDSIRTWAQNNARNASTVETKETNLTRVGVRKVINN